jgi:hypothetical protein
MNAGSGSSRMGTINVNIILAMMILSVDLLRKTTSWRPAVHNHGNVVILVIIIVPL